MANASSTRLRSADQHHPPRPHMPQRTLSSSLRLYSSPLIPRLRRISQTFPGVGSTLPPHRDAAETDSLLGTSPFHKPSSFGTTEVGDFGDVDGDADVEAEQSDEQADSDGLYPPNCCWTENVATLPRRSDPFGNSDCDVYGNIHRVRQEIVSSIDDPYSLDQLKSPRINVALVRPLVEKFYNLQDLSIVYCLLVNRIRFIRDQSFATHHQTVNLTRALLCELLAEKVLRRYNENNPGPRGLLKLSNILVANFDPFQGASESVVRDSSHASYKAQQKAAGRHHHRMTALEVAIVSESKSFLASTACQKVVDAIYRGKVVYSPSSYIDIMPDRWKKRPISLYDPRRGPVLNQYRLVVPRTRTLIELVQFIVLLALYVTVMTARETRQTTTYTVVEGVFDVFTLGWILDQFASILEHGWQVYTQNLWSFLDVTFSLQFLIYFGIRMHAMNVNDPDLSDYLAVTALDVLSCAAPVLIPRLAFNVMSENMLFLSLRAMMGDFITLSALAVWCFAGFLLSLKWLHNGLHDVHTISKWMIFVWFGLDGTGISESPNFHPYLGPALFIIFAFLGNTLFLTILVSMLSNTFSMISGNAVQEIQFRRAVLTLLGVKSDALFAFMPPFNLIALIIFLPLKFLLTARFFHTVNVFVVRVVNLPQLLLISWYERNTLWVSNNQYRHIQSKRIDWRNSNGPRVISTDWWSSAFSFWDWAKLTAHADIQAVFESEPPQETVPQHTDDSDTHPPLPIDLNLMSPNLTKSPTRSFKLHPHFSPKTSRPQTPKSLHQAPISSYQSDTPSTSSPEISTSTPLNTNNTTTTPTRRRRHKHRKSSDLALRREFHDSEEERELELLTRSRTGVAEPSARKRGARKDSTIDYEASDIGALHAIQGLERRMERLEEMLVRALGEVPGSDTDAEVTEAVLEDVRRERIEL